MVGILLLQRRQGCILRPKAAKVMKRKAEEEVTLLKKQKREVECDEDRCALQRVLLVYLHMWHLVLVRRSIGDFHVYM
jgi:hypothetical protein